MEDLLYIIEKLKSDNMNINEDELLIASEALTKTCCLCLTDDENLFLAAQQYKDSMQYSDLVYILLQIEIRGEVNFLLCDECSSTLKLFYKFRKKCYAINETLVKLKKCLVQQIELNAELPMDSDTDDEPTAAVENTIKEETSDGTVFLDENEIYCEYLELENEEEENMDNDLTQLIEVDKEITPIVEQFDNNSNNMSETVPYYQSCGPVSTTETNDATDETKYQKSEYLEVPEPKEESSLLKTHANKRPKRHICPECNHKVESPSKLKSHILARHRYSASDTWSTQEERQSALLENEGATENSQNVKTKRGRKPIDMAKTMCETCGKQFRNKNALSVHIRRHEGIKPYTCEICDMSFVVLYALERHKVKHTGLRPYQCRYCTEMFSHHGSRIRHERSHTGERPYVCSYASCGKSFKLSHGLASHLLIHTGKKPFICGTCGQCFRQSHHLSSHNNIHLREKMLPYVKYVRPKIKVESKSIDVSN